MARRLSYRAAYRALLALAAVLTVFATLHKIQRRNYNNYLMFTRPLSLLTSHENLYVHHPHAYKDLYKYSPTFPLLMTPFALLPDALGMLLWNLLNAVLPFVAARQLFQEDKRTVIFLTIILVELSTSVQNFQSNGVMTALFLLAFAALESGKAARGAIYVSLATFIKIFGVLSCALLPCFKAKRRFVTATLLWSAVLFSLPLAVISPQELWRQYLAWYEVVSVSATGSQLSVMGVLAAWTRRQVPFRSIQVIGLAIFLLPLLKVRCYEKVGFRRLLFASVLIFVVIFNQMAESPTYVIAMAGVALWFLEGEATPARVGTVLVAVVGVSLTQTDLFPRSFRTGLLYDYRVKAVAAIFLWLLVQYDLWTERFSGGRRTSTTG